jgi:hypothetical protein
MQTIEERTRLLGLEKAALILGISHWTLRNWCALGVCASHKVGRRRMISVEECDRIIRESYRPRITAA